MRILHTSGKHLVNRKGLETYHQSFASSTKISTSIVRENTKGGVVNETGTINKTFQPIEVLPVKIHLDRFRF